MSKMFVSFFSQKRGDVRKQRTKIENFLKDGPSTVTLISEKTGFEKKPGGLESPRHDALGYRRSC
jgi:hypothetical protein